MVLFIFALIFQNCTKIHKNFVDKQIIGADFFLRYSFFPLFVA